MTKIVIDANKCKGCSLCIEACPKKCLAISKKFNRAGYTPATFIEKSECTGCGFCYQVCPDVCIEIFR